jgi:hypothetical protein
MTIPAIYKDCPSREWHEVLMRDLPHSLSIMETHQMRTKVGKKGLIETWIYLTIAPYNFQYIHQDIKRTLLLECRNNLDRLPKYDVYQTENIIVVTYYYI